MLFVNLTEELALQFTWFEVITGNGTTLVILLPTLLLGLVNIVAIMLAQQVEIIVRIIVLNILTTDFLFSLNEIARGFHPVMELLDINITSPCKIYYYVHATVLDAQVFSITMYSFCTIVILKYGEKELKWKYILLTIGISWLVFIVVNPLILQGTIEASPALGICWFYAPWANSVVRTTLTWALDGILFPTLSVLFIVLACVYVKKSLIETSKPIQKGMLKNLVFLLTVSILDFLHLIVPSIIMIPTSTLAPVTSSNLWKTLVPLTIIHVVFDVSAFVPPVAMMVFLKPLQTALKSCSCLCNAK